MHDAKYDVLVHIYNSCAGTLGEFLSNQDPVQCLMFAETFTVCVAESVLSGVP